MRNSDAIPSTTHTPKSAAWNRRRCTGGDATRRRPTTFATANTISGHTQVELLLDRE